MEDHIGDGEKFHLIHYVRQNRIYCQTLRRTFQKSHSPSSLNRASSQSQPNLVLQNTQKYILGLNSISNQLRAGEFIVHFQSI